MPSLPVSKNASRNSAFRKQILVRFGDCDAAGIVFYPRYFDMFNSLVEDWCREELNFSFSEIVTRRGWGLPTVHLEVDFWAPSVFGDVLSAMLSVTALGKTSINLNIILQGGDSVDRVRGKVTLVLIDRKEHRAIPVPGEVRAKILKFQTDMNRSRGQSDRKRKAKA
jgi:4-hydroxybenzoyl-CoA thioesterase